MLDKQKLLDHLKIAIEANEKHLNNIKNMPNNEATIAAMMHVVFFIAYLRNCVDEIEKGNFDVQDIPIL